MYIAFKWLVGLAIAMWIAMCCIDQNKSNKFANKTGMKVKAFELSYKNISIGIPQIEGYTQSRHIKKNSMTVLHCLMFFAGALAVMAFNKKKIIISVLDKINKLMITNILIMSQCNWLKRTAKIINVALLKYAPHFWDLSKKYLNLLVNQFNVGEIYRAESNKGLVQTIMGLVEERKHLGQLLLRMLHENKNIRLKYQFEINAKNKLTQQIVDTQKQIDANKSQYVSFQQLYIVTHQENLFLKKRVDKLTNDKEDAEKNLMVLMNEVYKSKNTDLKAYCSRYLTKTRNNLLNMDVKSEIQKFLNKNQSSNRMICDNKFNSNDGFSTTNNFNVRNILHEDNLVPILSNSPKLKGLPGEYVWTIKDKDGIIEKLYEYDYESDIDNGVTIRRIRQYSVYYDEDCLLDFSNSRTISSQADLYQSGIISNQYCNVEYPLARQRFLTGSKAFRNFLQSNKHIVRSPSPPPPFTCV